MSEQQGSPLPEPENLVLSTSSYNLVLLCLIYVAFIIGLVGTAANTITIIIFIKMGLASSASINISYLSMAVSDIMTCIWTMLWAVLLIPTFDSYDLLPVVAAEIVTVAASWPSLAFNKTTTWITAWVALERCLCVVYPIKVRTLITRRRTILVIAVIFFITIAPMVLINAVYRYEWKPSELFPNKTVLGLRQVRTPAANALYHFLYGLYGVFHQWVPLGITITCTVFLVVHLRRRSKWKSDMTVNTSLQGTASQKLDSTEEVSQAFADSEEEQPEEPPLKDQTSSPEQAPGEAAVTAATSEPYVKMVGLQEDRIVKSVILVAILSILFSSPASVAILLFLDNPDLRPKGRYSQLNEILSFSGAILDMLNTCFNIMVYCSLGTRFRLQLKKLLRASNPAEN